MNRKSFFKLAGLALVVVLVTGLFSTAGTVSAAEDKKDPKINLTGLIWQALVSSTEKATGLSAKELKDALADGKSLAEILRGLGDDVAAVEAAAKADVRSKIDQQVADGKLTREQGEKLKARVDPITDRLINRKRRSHHHATTPTAQPTAAATPAQ